MSSPLEAISAGGNRAMPMPTANWIMVSPEAAKRMLVGPNIRPVNKDAVDHYVRQIRGGTWWLNGETIKFDSDGNLVDGQHRLLAVIETGIPIMCLVVTGVTAKGVDEGRQRTARDLLGGKGSKHASTKAAVLRILYAMQGEEQFRPFGGARWSNDELLGFLDRCDDDALTHACTVAFRTHRLLPGSVVATIVYQLRNSPRADEFFEALDKGENMRSGDPVYELRRWITLRREAGKSFQNEAGRRLCYHAIVAAWNAFVAPELAKPITQKWLTTAGSRAAWPIEGDPQFRASCDEGAWK